MSPINISIKVNYCKCWLLFICNFITRNLKAVPVTAGETMLVSACNVCFVMRRVVYRCDGPTTTATCPPGNRFMTHVYDPHSKLTQKQRLGNRNAHLVRWTRVCLVK